VTRVSGRTVAVIALVLYAGGGLALPPSLHWSVLWLVWANVRGTMLAAAVSLGWLGVQIQATQRRHLAEWTTDLRLLDAAEFEWLVGELFTREGWKVEETGRQGGPDRNLDLNLSKHGQRAIVQCKRWTSWMVGVDDVRAFAGTLHRGGLSDTASVTMIRLRRRTSEPQLIETVVGKGCRM
jgi:Restriction endonuclease